VTFNMKILHARESIILKKVRMLTRDIDA